MQLADHSQEVKYEMRPPPPAVEGLSQEQLYVHATEGHHSREIDEASERFVQATRDDKQAENRSAIRYQRRLR